MIFSSDKKKELWRYASKNILPSYEGPSIHTPPSSINQYQYSCQSQSQLEQKNHPSKTPPPPYIAVALGLGTENLESSLNMYGHQVPYQMDRQSETLIATNEGSKPVIVESDKYIKSACSCENFGENLVICDANTSLENCFLSYKNFCSQGGDIPSAISSPTLNAMRRPTQQSTFAVTAANIFRNCCGGGIFGESACSSVAKQDNACTFRVTSKKNFDSCQTFPTKWFVHTNMTSIHTVAQDFNLLMKQLKHKQISELLRAVKSRLDPPIITSRTNSLTNYEQCILIKLSENNEEQYVTTCRLFFWPDLRNALELKRIPVCPSGDDRIYVCCNPLHWCRKVDTELAPPPYQRQKTMRLKNTNLEDYCQIKCRNFTGDIRNPFIHPGELRDSPLCSVKSSLATEGADSNGESSMFWCRIAYWELSRRVGRFYNVKKPSICIYAEGSINSFCEGMCLSDLTDQKSSIDAVQHTREKIGLGVVLNLDSDDVWVYNRASSPIFVGSPTLNEGFDRVWKVMPGYCIKAFDNQRAKILNSKRDRVNQLGPVDWYSMRISFAKGWGHTYRRQDILGCPCWLDVHFSRLR